MRKSGLKVEVTKPWLATAAPTGAHGMQLRAEERATGRDRHMRVLAQRAGKNVRELEAVGGNQVHMHPCQLRMHPCQLRRQRWVPQIKP